MNPFSTLGISPKFDVDLEAAERAHRELSRALHPDRYLAAPGSERRSALTKAIEVNEAWRAVRDPIRRAEALLALQGVRVEEKGPQGDLRPDFLMEMLELREALAEARASKDWDAVQAMAAQVRTRAARCEEELTAGFARGQGAAMIAVLAEMRFYGRFLDEVGAIEDDLAI
ncbi:MAG: Fe-S protein assembly co-chaperone HscB [Polyangiaceae bacterium]|jgi:molecular chaperone HscB